jgi:hypothetical protein
VPGRQHELNLIWVCHCDASVVRGNEVKECLMGMVGTDKAKQEACFALEQIVFRAVLTG